MAKASGQRSLLLLLAVLLSCASCATVDPPRIAMTVPAVVHISPGVPDGVQDDLRLSADVLPDPGMVIRGFRIVVDDRDGERIRTVEQSWEGEPAGFLGKLLQDLGLRDKEGMDESLVVMWDGRMDTGDLAPDGEYLCRAEVWDDRDNERAGPDIRVVVDNTPPKVTARTDYAMFSPNGDGERDVLIVRQSGSSEDLWSGVVRSAAGDELRHFEWSDSAPGDVEWDGRGDAGFLLFDGFYSYEIRSTDRAGNTTIFTLNDRALNTTGSAVSVRTDAAAFSPNDDGTRDVLTISPTVFVTEGLTRWRLRILDAQDQPVRTLEGRDVAPFEWDGVSDDGSPAPDGEYIVEVQAVFSSGTAPTARSNTIVLDTRYPEVDLSASARVFSPEGDGRKDTVVVAQRNSSVEELWEGTIRDSAGEIVRAFQWSGALPDLEWDGTDDGGRDVPDGAYVYEVGAVDAGGNALRVRSAQVRVDRRPATIDLGAVPSAFSPNGDGKFDVIEIAADLSLPDGISSWSFTVQDTDTGRRSVVAEGGAAGVPLVLQWDGKDDSGLVREGRYVAVLDAVYEKGDVVRGQTEWFVLDITPPQTTFRVYPLPFSPDDDGVNDTLTFALEVEDAGPIDHWDIRIMDPMEHLFRRFLWIGAPRAPVDWDGRSTGGELVQSASLYRVELTVVDSVANTYRESLPLPVDVLVMREGDRLKMRITSIYFAPFTAEFAPERAAENRDVLHRLAEILAENEGYSIRIEGHAVQVYWYDAERGKREEQQVLIPLSGERAEAIKQALVELGVEEGRMSAFGYGGSRPVVPHSDEDNRWKSRRVEFILIRE